jgi:hypothetical protein
MHLHTRIRMRPHRDWGIYTNIRLNNIKNKLNWGKRYVTNVTMMSYWAQYPTKCALDNHDIHHPLDVITQMLKNKPKRVQ